MVSASTAGSRCLTPPPRPSPPEPRGIEGKRREAGGKMSGSCSSDASVTRPGIDAVGASAAPGAVDEVPPRRKKRLQDIDLLERAQGIKERECGPEHPSVASSLINLGNAYGELGDVVRKRD